MNIYLIHGDNSLTSYNRLQEYVNKGKDKGWEVTEIEDKEVNIIDILRSDSLFGNKRLVVVKEYSLLSDKAIEFINKTLDDIELIIYHGSAIPVTFIKKLKNVKKNEVFKLSKYLWKFIDNFYPGNTKNCLYYFHESLKNDPAELLFTILAGQIKDIFLTLYSDEPLPYPPWRLSNIKRQSEKFGKEKIKMTIDELAKIDIKVKTSSADLKDELDLFIMRKLE